MTATIFASPLGVTAWDREAVAEFDRRKEDILIVERPPLVGLADAVASARVLYWESTVTSENAAARAADALAALGIECPAFAEDVASLARGFLAQFGIGEAALRVEVVDKPTCPKFHCDNVSVRLVTTYHGPPTEYVRADAPELIRSAPAFALVFLKGHQHPAHADAIHHRSPAVPPGGKRLCVVLDI